MGAGAFGGWTALFLLRKGTQTTLIDAWGPGNSRASSGGETRVIRAIHGSDRIYTEMVARSLELFRENEARWNRKLYRQCGVLWMAGGSDAYERASLDVLSELGLGFETWSVEEAEKHYPQIHFERVSWVIYEHDAGYLLARRTCQAVTEGFIAEGGDFRQLSAEPLRIDHGRLTGLGLSDGSRIEADQYVFACGPWLDKIFPEALGGCIHPTRQEAFYFGTPAGDPRFDEDSLPAWIDNGERLMYGIPGSEWRGFKVADDTHGGPFEPTTGERTITEERLAEARNYLHFRFPGLTGAPLIEARVCQYANSPDGHFIVDRHPEASNLWIVGGGSGRGFKHGPALGERVTEQVWGERPVEPFFALSRFQRFIV